MIDHSLLGQQLDEYRLEALLGQGGMASVYRALDTRLKRYAAVKVIRTSYRSDSDYLARFEREAQAIAKLDHPNIVRLYRYGEVQGLFYMAMQYIEGLDLSSVLASYQADKEFIEPEEAGHIIRLVCLALDYSHGKGVIHRDIKPSNIMLDKQGNVFLTDFGLALSTEVGTRGEIFGSPHYIAPEQAISSANAKPQSDLYSVGVILYEMFTGQVPFEAETPLDVAMMHLTEPLRPPSELRPGLSPELEAVIVKALAKEPEERYANGAALAEALDHAILIKAKSPPPRTTLRLTIPDRISVTLADRPLPPISGIVPLARQPSEPMPAPTAPVIKRNRWLIWLIGAGIGLVLMMLLCLLAVFLWWRASQSGNASVMVTPTVAVPSQALQTATTPAASPTLATTPAVSPTLAATPAVSPTLTTTLAVSPTLAPSATSSPMETAVPPTLAPIVFKLLIAKSDDDDSLFVVNQSPGDFPLAPFRLGETAKGGIQGEDWQVDSLKSGECATAWKNTGNPQAPDVNCSRTGKRLTRDNKSVFWKSTFNVYYAGQQIGACDKSQAECTFTITGQ